VLESGYAPVEAMPAAETTAPEETDDTAEDQPPEKNNGS